MKKNHIIGGGPTGLALATFLEEPCIIYEKESKAGGCHAIFYRPYYTEHSPKMYNTAFKETLDLLDGIIQYKEIPNVTNINEYYRNVDKDLLYYFSQYTIGFLDKHKKLSKKHIEVYKELLSLVESVEYTEWTYYKLFQLFTFNYNSKTLQPTNDFCDEWRKKLENKGVKFVFNTEVNLQKPDIYTKLKSWKTGDSIYFCAPIKQLYKSLERPIPREHLHKVYKKTKSYTLIYKKTKNFKKPPPWYSNTNGRKYGIVYIQKDTELDDTLIVLSCVCIQKDLDPFVISKILNLDGFPNVFTFTENKSDYSGNTNFGNPMPTDFGHFVYLNHSNGFSDYPFNTIESSIQNVKKYLEKNFTLINKLE